MRTTAFSELLFTTPKNNHSNESFFSLLKVFCILTATQCFKRLNIELKLIYTLVIFFLQRFPKMKLLMKLFNQYHFLFPLKSKFFAEIKLCCLQFTRGTNGLLCTVKLYLLKQSKTRDQKQNYRRQQYFFVQHSVDRKVAAINTCRLLSQ